MNIYVFGRTDHRAVIYTFMKLLQPLGDVGLITDNTHYRRLFGESEYDTEFEGDIENIHVVITNASPEDVFPSINMSSHDFEHIIYDNIMPASEVPVSAYVYCKGLESSTEELDILEQLDDVITINIGEGRGCIPYSVKALQVMERIECKHILATVDAKATSIVSGIISKATAIPASTVRKVGAE